MGRDADDDREPEESGFRFVDSGGSANDATSDDADGSDESETGFRFVGETEAEQGETGDESVATGADPDATAALEPAPSLEAARPSEDGDVPGDASALRAGAAVGEPAPAGPPAILERDEREATHAPAAGEEHDADHEAHHPVVEDWPRGVGEASWWPIVTAIGTVGIYLSVALWLLGRGRGSVIAASVGPVAFLGALAVTIFGVYGWLYHGFVAHFWTRGTNRLTARSLRWAMLGFIVSEIMTFGALFADYFYIRAGPWPPADAMAGGIDLLNVLVVANTGVLLLSSLTLHFAHHALAHDDRDRFTRLLGLTIGLGLLFLAGQAVEYHQFINREGFTWTSGVFGSAFFGLTGLHGAHVAFGALLLTITLVRARHGQFDAERELSVSLVSLYWHFVDAVWLFLVVAVYVGASISPDIPT